MYSVEYWSDFDDFLKSLNDEKRVAIINEAISDFAAGKLDLDPKDCVHYDNRVKIAITNANVVVYFDMIDKVMCFIGGDIIHPRAA